MEAYHVYCKAAFSSYPELQRYLVLARRKKDIDKIISAVRIHIHALLMTDVGHRFHEGKERPVQMTSVASKVVLRQLQVKPVGHWL